MSKLHKESFVVGEIVTNGCLLLEFGADSSISQGRKGKSPLGIQPDGDE